MKVLLLETPVLDFGAFLMTRFLFVSLLQLPKMLEDDAIARYYGLEKGQVVKVSYAEDITGTLVAYRCVV